MSKWSWHLHVLGSLQRNSSHTEGDAEFVHSAQGMTGPSDQHEQSLQQPQKHQKQTHSIRECWNSSKAESSAPNAADRVYWQRNMSFTAPSWCPLCHLPGSVTPPPHAALGDALTHEVNTSPFAEPPPPLSQLSLSQTCDTLFPLLILTVSFSHTETKDTGETAMLTRSYTCI